MIELDDDSIKKIYNRIVTNIHNGMNSLIGFRSNYSTLFVGLLTFRINFNQDQLFNLEINHLKTKLTINSEFKNAISESAVLREAGVKLRFLSESSIGNTFYFYFEIKVLTFEMFKFIYKWLHSFLYD